MNVDTEGANFTLVSAQCLCLPHLGYTTQNTLKSEAKAEMRGPKLRDWEEVKGGPMPCWFIWHKCRH